jgi:hypothetical protein
MIIFGTKLRFIFQAVVAKDLRSAMGVLEKEGT